MTIPTKTQAKCPSVLAKHADTIRQLSKQTVENIIEIGRRLVDCRDNHLEHGEWLPWLQREFGWSDRTALNFIRVYEQSKSENFSDLNLPVSSLYLLAAPSTPETAKSEIIKRAKTGTPVSVAEVKQTINAAKARRAAEATGKALPVAKRVGADGKARARPAKKARKQPAKKAKSKTPEAPKAAASAPERETPARETPARAQQDVGPQSTSEVERLRARVDELQAEKRQLEIKITGLKSEVEELKAENAELRAKLEAAACTPACVPPENGERPTSPSTNGKGKFDKHIIEDPKQPGRFRVKRPDGTVTIPVTHGRAQFVAEQLWG
jgi:Protein of unknown function (DUF3102)